MKQKLLLLLTSVSFFVALIAALFWLFQQPTAVRALDITVDITNDEDDGSCGAGDCSLREAIAAASPGDRIVLGSNTYTLDLGQILIAKSLTISGTGSANTIIDGNLSSNPDRLFHISSGTITFTAVSLTGGQAISTTEGDRGGAIWAGGLQAPTVTLLETHVVSNVAATQGGGIFIGSGLLNLIDNSAVITNSAVTAGGGIVSSRAGIVITNSQVNDNEAPIAAGIQLVQADSYLIFESGEINDNTATSTSPISFPGGGINVGNGTAYLNGGEIRHNSAYRGGGIFVPGGDVFLDGTTIVSNTATFGGGVYIHGASSSATLTQTSGVISDNLATTDNGFGGGGLYIFQGDFVLEGGEVSNNRSLANGGGLEVADGSFVATGGLMAGNQAGDYGGAIYNDRAVITITNLTISENNADLGGGGIYANNNLTVSTTIVQSAIISNTGVSGGGIFNNQALSITNSTLSGNSGDAGGGILNSATGTAALHNVTVNNNSATTNSGGLSNQSGTLTVANTILAGNTSPTGPDCTGTITSADYNLIGDETGCNIIGVTTNNQNGPALLGNLSLNSGPTMNHLPLTGSPAVDTANNTICPQLDQRGFMRPVDASGGTNPICDIGAVEIGNAYFISDVTVTEGDAGNTQALFVVSRSMLTGTTTVDYSVAGNTAVLDTDFSDTSGTLSFNSSQLTRTIQVDVIGDMINEADETFTVTLSSPSPSVGFGDPEAVGTILNDDPLPSLSIADVTINEGDGIATFTVTLSAESEQTVMVDYQTNDNGAVSPGDYVADSGTLTLPAGTFTDTIEITINEDTLDEYDEESFTIDLENPQNALLGDAQGVGTITDNDDPVTLVLSDASEQEDSGTLGFTLSISESGKTIIVNYNTSDNSSAIAGSDYTAATSSVTFNPGDTSKTVDISLTADTIDEVDETFLLNVSGSAADIQIPDSSATGTILDDDGPPALRIGDVVVTEGDSGQVQMTFTVTLESESGKLVTANFATADNTAKAGLDYTSQTGNVSFTAGALTDTFNVPVLGDMLVEGDETFSVLLTNPVNATLADDEGIGTIEDNEATPVLTVADGSILERDSSQSDTLFITVTLSVQSSNPVTVTYATEAGTAIAGLDYTAVSDTLVFDPGQMSKTVSVNIVGDNLYEDNEVFYLMLSDPQLAVIGDGQGVVTILNDDEPLVFLPFLNK